LKINDQATKLAGAGFQLGDNVGIGKTTKDGKTSYTATTTDGSTEEKMNKLTDIYNADSDYQESEAYKKL
jgi:hypothetical protein